MTVSTVVCVLRHSREFGPEHVWSLYDSVVEWWPRDQQLKFVCLTDKTVYEGIPAQRGHVHEIALHYNWPGWWAKLELFRPDLHELGDMLYFDLDTVIVGDLSDIAARQRLTCLTDFYRTKKPSPNMASGMMYIPQQERGRVWYDWIIKHPGGPVMHMQQHRGDQNFIRTLWEEECDRWQDVLPGQVCSFKADVRKLGAVPHDARVVCYHGNPRPWSKGGALPLADAGRYTLKRGK